MQEPHSECYDYALHYLYRYPKSYRDMQAKLLEKQYTSDEVQETMDYLVYKGYIDDAKYAESYLTSECINKGKPFIAIQAKLLQKGIDKQLIQQVYTDMKHDIQFSMLEKIWQEWDKLSTQGKDTLYILQKLQRKGYRYDDIKQALLQYGKEK